MLQKTLTYSLHFPIVSSLQRLKETCHTGLFRGELKIKYYFGDHDDDECSPYRRARPRCAGGRL